MSTLANETVLETLAETIFEEMVKSFKDLTPSDEQIIYECACEEAIKQTSWQTGTLKPHRGFFIGILKESNEFHFMIVTFGDPRFEDDAIAALMEEALSTDEETKFDVESYIENSNFEW